MASKNYTAPGLTNSPALRYELLADEAIALAGVVIETSTTIAGTSTVTVFADVDPTIADAEIQAVIDAHDQAADYVLPETTQRRFEAALPSYPFIGAFESVSDLPTPTIDGAVAIAEGKAWCRSSGAWAETGDGTISTLLAQCSTTQAGGDPVDVAPSYSQINGCAWDGLTYLRSTGNAAAWHARAYAGRLAFAGDRISWPGWAAEPDGGNFGVVFLPAGEDPAPAQGSSISEVWGAQWVGGFSLLGESSGTKWKFRGAGPNGSGFPPSGTTIQDGQTLSVKVNSALKVDAWIKTGRRESSFNVGAGLDVWVVFESTNQRWPGAYRTATQLPVPGTPGGPGTSSYQPTAALRLDGSNDVVEIPNVGSVLRWDVDWTACVRFPNASQIDHTYGQTLLGRGSYNGLGLVRNGSVYQVAVNRPVGYASQTFASTVDLSGARVFFDYQASSKKLRVYVNENTVTTITVSSNDTSASVLAGDLVVGALPAGSSYFWAWGGLVHELFVMDRRMSSSERDDVIGDANLANASWYGDVVGWWPLGTGDTYPTVRNLVAGGSDGTLINALPSAIEEL